MFSKSLPVFVATVFATNCAHSAACQKSKPMQQQTSPMRQTEDHRHMDQGSQQQMPYDQGHSAKKEQMMGAYNAPARYDVRGSWDVFIDASFIYWQMRQAGMAYVFSNPSNQNANSGLIPNLGGKVIDLDYDYKPGFEVGFGFALGTDNWVAYAHYKRLHGTQSGSSTRPSNLGNLQPLWLHFGNITPLVSATARWKCDIDILDFDLMRRYYVGKKLLFELFFGTRAAWIDQNYRQNYVTLANADIPSRTKSDSWSLGPRVGLNSDWELGWGFCLIGNIAFNTVYTRYKISHRENEAVPNNVFIIKAKRSFLRPMLESALGMGWGAYFGNNGWHIDFSATYDFNVYWNQNMMAFLTDASVSSARSGHGDLYLHGLKVKARLDF